MSTPSVAVETTQVLQTNTQIPETMISPEAKVDWTPLPSSAMPDIKEATQLDSAPSQCNPFPENSSNGLFFSPHIMNAPTVAAASFFTQKFLNSAWNHTQAALADLCSAAETAYEGLVKPSAASAYDWAMERSEKVYGEGLKQFEELSGEAANEGWISTIGSTVTSHPFVFGGLALGTALWMSSGKKGKKAKD